MYFPFSPPLSFFFLMIPPPPRSTLFPYTTLFRSLRRVPGRHDDLEERIDHRVRRVGVDDRRVRDDPAERAHRSEEHTSELQSQSNLVCRLRLEKKKN